MPTQKADATFLAAELRKLARRFDALPEIAADEQLLRNGGKLIIEAGNKGLLRTLPKAVAWVAWAQGKGPNPDGGPASEDVRAGRAHSALVRCPANLFREICGNHQYPRRLLADGTSAVAGNVCGGVMRETYPAAFRIDAPSLPKRRERELQSATCEALAAMIENAAVDNPTSPPAINGESDTAKLIGLIHDHRGWKVEQFTTAMGMSRTTFYRHFPKFAAMRKSAKAAIRGNPPRKADVE